MWRMQDGDRVMTDAEWELFAAGLDMLRDSVEADLAAVENDTEAGVRVFDVLTPEQKLGLLVDVAQALRDPAVPMPRHTAANEGAIAAVFEYVREMVEAELSADPDEDGKTPTEIRRLIRAAAEGHPHRPRKLPAPTRDSQQVWENLLEEIESRVLWDYDFVMGDEFLDLPPEEARAELQRYGIDPDYYLAVPREPDERGLIAARQTLARLLELPIPDEHGLYPAIQDRYHELAVGPCSPEVLAQWAHHSWVEVVGFIDPGWDCDYEEWTTHFRDAIPNRPFTIQPSPPATGAAGELPPGIRVEKHGGRWVIRDEEGSYWCDVIGNTWVELPDEATPALSYPSEAEARSAYLQADRMYEERAARHRAAAELLGLEDD